MSGDLDDPHLLAYRKWLTAALISALGFDTSDAEAYAAFVEVTVASESPEEEQLDSIASILKDGRGAQPMPESLPLDILNHWRRRSHLANAPPPPPPPKEQPRVAKPTEHALLLLLLPLLQHLCAVPTITTCGSLPCNPHPRRLTACCRGHVQAQAAPAPTTKAPVVDESSGPIPASIWASTREPDAVCIAVASKPNARRSQILELNEEAVEVHIAARAREGAANTELVAFMAQVLGVRRGAVAVATGARSRTKLVTCTAVLGLAMVTMAVMPDERCSGELSIATPCPSPSLRARRRFGACRTRHDIQRAVRPAGRSSQQFAGTRAVSAVDNGGIASWCF
ncbi:hypothetical protein JKP88DRAFT_295840 [Tribonema minus]|uniref:Uncharacterized protein n=1 Tax=Tribonema minus TaxID=303371 RepID=A0A835ZD36_9STRA|nr:hypothetical protein JKP88DRAFT_295840 [Tribonema minus]